MAVGKCVAVGASGPAGLIETLAAGLWTASKAPTAGLRPMPPTGEGTYVALDTISCPSLGTCLVVGRYGRSTAKSTTEYAFSERENG